VLELPSALDTHQHAEHADVAYQKRRLSAPAPQREVFAIKESLAPYRLRCVHHWRHQTGRNVRKINASKRLIDLECSRVACFGVNVTPVVQAKRHIAVFLNLENYNVSA
jgi:hypothetical protein